MSTARIAHITPLALAVLLSLATLPRTPSAWAAGRPFLDKLHTITTLASTVPANGDVNPYGVAVVPRTVGALLKGNILVSNFNNSGNVQGTGTTIVQVAPSGSVRLFAEINPADSRASCPGGIGLTTALVVLRSGWVLVGSLPTANSGMTIAGAGCLLVVNRTGQVVTTIQGAPLNGPWDMTAVELNDHVALFVTNVLNGTVAGSGNPVPGGTVVRIDLQVEEDAPPAVLATTVIGAGFLERTDPAALVIGPTGVGLGRHGTLYVADTLANRLAAIPDALFREDSAGPGTTVATGGALNGPLGLAVAPNGDLLVANGGDGNLVETTPAGEQVAVTLADTTGAGAGTLFGLAVAPGNRGVYFVNDGNNTLDVLH